MARHSREKFRSARIKQNSAFLNLPGEIRTLIYRAALVKDTPLDLWPNKFIQDNVADPVLLKRLLTSQKTEDRNLIEWISVRDQHDLQYVRKEMATGLLASCKQVWMEASMLFWQENSFRFSGDSEWTGLRRFLTTIGPDARSRIRNLEVVPPGWLNHYLCPIDRSIVQHERQAKNHPKMHMVKCLPFYTRKDRLYRAPSAQTEDNVRYVCEMLRAESTVRKLNLIVLKGWSFDQLFEEPGIWNHQHSFLSSLQALTRSLDVSLTLETGSRMLGLQNREMLNRHDITLIAQPGTLVTPQSITRQENGSPFEAREVTELQIWAPSDTEDFLSDAQKLFDENNRLALPSRGGKIVKTSHYGRKKYERVLKGFGGCRFIQRYGNYCNCCSQELKDPYQMFQKHKYYCHNCKALDKGYSWKDGLEVRKMSRELRMWQPAEEEEDDW